MFVRMSLVLAAVWLAVATNVSAAAQTVPASPGQGIQISPAITEITAKPGQNVSFKISVLNVTDQTLYAATAFNDFTAKDEEGDASIILDPTETTPYSLWQWMRGPQKLTLAPHETKTVVVTVDVPADAEPGGHYGVVRFTAGPADGSQNMVNLSASIGELVLLRTAGNVKENLNLKDFYASQGGNRHSWFEFGPIDFVERIENTGDVHEQPTGSIVITNWLGGKEADFSVNSPPHNVLPQSIRRFDQDWPKKLLFGRYVASLKLSYANGKTLAAQVVFWVIPWPLLLLILLFIIVMVLYLRAGIRRYNQRIIERARRNGSE